MSNLPQVTLAQAQTQTSEPYDPFPLLTEGGIAVAIILALAVLIRALTELVDKT